MIARRALPLLVPSALALLAGPARAQARFAGDWSGSYVCGQGVTGLHLRLRARGDGGLVGLFHFHPLPDNPVAAEGCFEVAGQPRGDAVTLSAGTWLLRPENYVTVDLEARLGKDGTLSGQVEGPGCDRFTLRRVAGSQLPPAACGTVVSAY
ncbi:hypothetical protein ACVFYP_08255 [Roseomonas sp. F4]